jgi:hypothetical protein
MIGKVLSGKSSISSSYLAALMFVRQAKILTNTIFMCILACIHRKYAMNKFLVPDRFFRAYYKATDTNFLSYQAKANK